jgi:peptidoglycan/xylan/chitin deacetylase (PgdA/CDA1 family)
MDEAVIRARRAALRRRVRRRRQAGLGGVLVVVLGVAAALASAGGDSSRPASRSVAARAAPPVAPAAQRAPARKPVGLKHAAAMAGAHRAAHEAVPILMYHVIGTRGPLTPNPGLWVAPADLAAQVHALRHRGYHAVTLQDVWDAWHHHGELPRKPLVLSFDDGYLGQVRDALPALAAVGWAGVLNLELNNLADLGGTKAVKRLIAAGWEVDAHTITHPDLTTLDAGRLHDEVAGSRARLRRLFGVAVNFFCYPSGRYDATVIAAVKAAGYLAATTTQLGWASPAGAAFALPRVRVDGAMSPDALLQRLQATRAAPQPAGA